ncbi:hypothetical protein DDE83_000633 [Stemphylium lycopersici]|uniref:Uncharacterized protein n=1 Tax=Stemphylium lycopersici TaxID=183478 RepID=A0A364NFH8_STELY|nr:hypothetical protein DDE83_000633 [Stemphylium lycopersici]
MISLLLTASVQSFDPLPRTDTPLQFDTLGFFPGPFPLVPFLRDVAPASGAIYTSNFRLASSGGLVPICAGVNPQSGANVAIFATPTTGNMTTTARCIRLDEFYHGCTTTSVQGNLNVPFGCRVVLKSFDDDDALVETKEVIFTPKQLPLADMNRAIVSLKPAKVVTFTAFILPEFVDIVQDALSGLGLGLPIAELLATATGSLFDNIRYVQSDDDAVCGGRF